MKKRDVALYCLAKAFLTIVQGDLSMKHYDFPEYVVDVDGNKNRKIVAKDNSYHLLFNGANGCTYKFGATISDDPTHCPWGNEIADIEITTSCRGIRGKDGVRKPCAFCYKSNTANGKYMTFETFKGVFDLINQPKTMTQIALGVDAECKGNPDVWKIMDYCLENDVTPNITVADIDEETAENIVKRCGACAVSCYERNKDCCYNSIRLLLDTAERQGKKDFAVNMHLLISHETQDFVFEVLNDRLNDGRLKGMGAIVLLSLKRKGRGKAFSKMDEDAYCKAIEFVDKHKIAYGSDSCGANKLMAALKKVYSNEWALGEIKKRFCKEDGNCVVATFGEKEFLHWGGPEDNELGKDCVAHWRQLIRIDDNHSIMQPAMSERVKRYIGVEPRTFTDENGADVPKACCYERKILETKVEPCEKFTENFEMYARLYAHWQLEKLSSLIEPCESYLYSLYINVDGVLFPCSFMEGEGNWVEGIDLKDAKYDNFTAKVWNHPKVLEWRNQAIKCIKCKGCNECPFYEV